MYAARNKKNIMIYLEFERVCKQRNKNGIVYKCSLTLKARKKGGVQLRLLLVGYIYINKVENKMCAVSLRIEVRTYEKTQCVCKWTFCFVFFLFKFRKINEF